MFDTVEIKQHPHNIHYRNCEEALFQLEVDTGSDGNVLSKQIIKVGETNKRVHFKQNQSCITKWQLKKPPGNCRSNRMTTATWDKIQ